MQATSRKRERHVGGSSPLSSRSSQEPRHLQLALVESNERHFTNQIGSLFETLAVSDTLVSLDDYDEQPVYRSFDKLEFSELAPELVDEPVYRSVAIRNSSSLVDSSSITSMATPSDASDYSSEASSDWLTSMPPLLKRQCAGLLR